MANALLQPFLNHGVEIGLATAGWTAIHVLGSFLWGALFRLENKKDASDLCVRMTSVIHAVAACAVAGAALLEDSPIHENRVLGISFLATTCFIMSCG